MHKLQAIETLGQRLGDLRMACQEHVPIELRSRFQGGEIFLHCSDHPRIVQGHGGCVREHVGLVTHNGPPSAERNSAKAGVHIFFTLSTVRPIRCATSANFNPSRWRKTITSRYSAGKRAKALASSTACSRRAAR